MRKSNLIKLISDKCSNIDEPDSHKLVTFLNPYSYQVARRNIGIFAEFHEIHCDGIALVLALRLFRFSITRRSFDMTSVARDVLSEANDARFTVFLIGSTQPECEAAASAIKKAYPCIRMIGFRSGYFSNNMERNNTLDLIKSLNPKIVIAGMGAPIQEKFLLDLSLIGWRGHGYTCGGFIHQLANSGITYYPKIFDKLNLRWLYRIIKEPKLLRRYLLIYPLFIPLFIKDLLTKP